MQPDAGSPGVRVGRPPRHAECEWPGDADRQLSRWHRAACICANGTPKCAISIGKESCREPWWPQPRDLGRSSRLFQGAYSEARCLRNFPSEPQRVAWQTDLLADYTEEPL